MMSVLCPLYVSESLPRSLPTLKKKKEQMVTGTAYRIALGNAAVAKGMLEEGTKTGNRIS